MFDIYLELHRLYGEKLGFVTKPRLNVDEFDYLPRPLPDSFMTLNSDTDRERHFFLEYFDEGVSIGIHGRRIAQHMTYKHDGNWTATNLPFPAIVIVCQSPLLLKQAEKRIRYLERQYDSEIQFQLVDLATLHAAESADDQIWIDPIEKTKTVL
ncbi:hypothetical protein D9M68_919310 [compost metagenome]